MTAMPCGQKKRSKAMIQSQTVTPPLAAIDGTTLRLKTATTKSKTRSKRPSTRLRWGWLAGSALDDNTTPGSLAAKQTAEKLSIRIRASLQRCRHPRRITAPLGVAARGETAGAKVRSIFITTVCLKAYPDTNQVLPQLAELCSAGQPRAAVPT